MAKVARKASQRLAAQLRRASEASVRAAILAARALLVRRRDRVAEVVLFVLLLAAYVLVKIVFTEAGRVPVDDPRTHLELTMIHEVMCLDYCGVDLAYIKIGGWLKTAALSVLAADAVAATCCPRWWAAAPLAVLVTGLSVGIVESTQARNKLARNTTFILTVAALAVLVFFTGYLLQLNIGLQ